jgi:NADPH:quinone reductase-like Zn-dependent oxidoreductase
MSNIKFYHVGYTTVVTTSPRDLEREKEVGTTEVIDFKVADVVDKLRELGPYKYLSQ